MATPWNKIFIKANSLFNDAKLLSSLNDEELTELLSLFFNESKSLYFKSCVKNLSDVEEPDFYTQDFIYTDSNIFTITQYPNNPEGEAIEYICKVNDINITTYTFDEDTLTFTITSTLEEDDEVECGYNFYGQCNVDLDDEEQWIIAKCISYIWLERQVYKEERLKVRLGNRDYKKSSPANMLDKLLALKKDTKKELDFLVNNYTYNGFEGFR